MCILFLSNSSSALPHDEASTTLMSQLITNSTSETAQETLSNSRLQF